MMHPETRALLLAAIRAELQADPSSRGYPASKDPVETARLLNAPVVFQPPGGYQDVSISDVEGYLRARLLVTRLRLWAATAPDGLAKDAALELLDIIASPRLSMFTTSSDAGRANVLGLFALLAEAGAGGITTQHLTDLSAMTLAPAKTSVESASRWSVLIEGIGGKVVIDETTGERVELSGPPNAADEALIAEALA